MCIGCELGMVLTRRRASFFCAARPARVTGMLRAPSSCLSGLLYSHCTPLFVVFPQSDEPRLFVRTLLHCALARLLVVLTARAAVKQVGCAAPELGDELGRALLAEARADSEYATRLRRELQVRPSLRMLSSLLA